MATDRTVRLSAMLLYWALSPIVFYVAYVLIGFPVTLLATLGIISEDPTGWVQAVLVVYALIDVVLSAAIVWLLWRRLRASGLRVQLPDAG